ncbi:unnamed protein product [Microthlaspi erraticum]|uniref:Uncharacterized protein n=1 Tax=Microthlaspi erraticum TaxID=1685480 RepID=A0A6D2KH01_9BRAS|nr:unnamed protein product [Microthlaspi erraticum]
MGRKEHGGTWHMDAAQLDTQRKKGEAILKTSSTVYSTNRSSSSTRPAKLQLDRAEKSTVKPEKCVCELDRVGLQRLGRARLTTGRKRVQRSQRVQEEPEVLVADTMDVPEGNGNPLGMDSVELVRIHLQRSIVERSSLKRKDLINKLLMRRILRMTRRPNYGQLLNGVTEVHQTSQATIKSHFGRQIQKIGRRNHHGS